MTTKPDFEKVRKEVERWSAGCPDSGYFTASDYITIDDARIAAEERVAKLEKQNDVLRRNMKRYFEERNHYRNLVFELEEKLAFAEIKEIDNEE